MTRSATPPEERYAVAWALPPDAAEQPDGTAAATVPSEDSEDFDSGVHCPACGGRRMQPVDVDDVGRCDRCLDCERLWAVDDDGLELVLGPEPRRDSP